MVTLLSILLITISIALIVVIKLTNKESKMYQDKLQKALEEICLKTEHDYQSGFFYGQGMYAIRCARCGYIEYDD